MHLVEDILLSIFKLLPPSSATTVAQASKLTYQLAMPTALSKIHLQDWCDWNPTGTIEWVKWLTSAHPYLPYPPCHYIKSLHTPYHSDILSTHVFTDKLLSKIPNLSELVVLNTGEQIDVFVCLLFIPTLTTLSMSSATIDNVLTGSIPVDITFQDWNILHSLILQLSKVPLLASLSLTGDEEENEHEEKELAHWDLIQELSIASPLLDLPYLKHLKLQQWQRSLVPPTSSLLHLSVYCHTTFEVLWAHTWHDLQTVEIDFMLDGDEEIFGESPPIDNYKNHSFSHIDFLEFTQKWYIPSRSATMYDFAELPHQLFHHIKSLSSLSFADLMWDDCEDELRCETFDAAARLKIRSLTFDHFYYPANGFEDILSTMPQRFSPIPLIHLSIRFVPDLFKDLAMDPLTACKRLGQKLAEFIPTLMVLELEVLDADDDEERVVQWWRIERREEVPRLEEIWSEVGEAAVQLIQRKAFKLQALEELFITRDVY
ncbi:uncharacterized protein BXZ73DRAFT_108231 [Epithele typhae]|uniref:uncharacterized protein n=1 Tax=Epithele typhae TaxID=378194 RepID=UPI002008D067|nr:uncharacterized protein BXZ73DRAFT_108231 [Epithele typhae]KAH9911157.1 hypothetical protein BXZ73DRAFT_108231 [Epithele typhae]